MVSGMTEPPKKRFPKKKPVEELPDKEVWKRLFPRPVRKEMEKVAHTHRPKGKKPKGDND